VVDLVNS